MQRTAATHAMTIPTVAPLDGFGISFSKVVTAAAALVAAVLSSANFVARSSQTVVALFLTKQSPFF